MIEKYLHNMKLVNESSNKVIRSSAESKNYCMINCKPAIFPCGLKVDSGEELWKKYVKLLPYATM